MEPQESHNSPTAGCVPSRDSAKAASVVDKMPSWELQVLAVRRVTDRIEVIVSWVPDPTLLQDAEGTQLHLSSHLFDPADGRMLVFDGPRAIPGLGPYGKLSVLPLAVPLEPGRYRLQIEPVVERRFLGFGPWLHAALARC